ncbi:MAG: glutathione S-transferase family protein [bacterium]
MPEITDFKSPLVGLLRGLHLFHFEGAPCAQRVRFALAEKGLARGREVPWNSDAPEARLAADGTWVSRHVSLIKKQHLTEEYAQIQPNMVVPALVHDGRLYIESMDIVQYLDETWSQNRLIPADPRAAEHAFALVEQGKQLHVSVRYVSFRWGLGRLGKLNAKEEASLRALERADSPEGLASFYGGYDANTIAESTYRAHLEALEHAYDSLDRSLRSDGRAFLTGDSFSIADILWSLAVLRIHECGYPFRRNFPALFEWYSRVYQRPGFQRGVLARHKTLSTAFKLKAGVENLFGVGLARASRSA